MGKKKKERQHQAIQYLPKEEPKNIYILTEKIEKLAKDEYVFHSQIFKMGNDGTIQTETEQEKFDRMLLPIFSADEIGLSKNKSELDILKQENDIEYSNILKDQKKWLVEQKEAPNSDDIKNILKYIDNVKGRFIIWYSDNNLERAPIDDTTKKKFYTRVEVSKAANIEIAAALRTYPKPPKLAELEKESMRVLTKGKISKTTWWNLHQKNKFWKLVTEEIEDRLNSKRKLEQVTVDKLVSLKDILRADLAKMKIRKEWEERTSSGDIFEEKKALEYIDENMGYIKTKKDKIPDLGDNKDDQEATELDDYGAGANRNLD